MELACIISEVEGYLDKLNDSHYFTGVDKFIPYLIKKKASLFEYLKEKHVVFFEETNRTIERMKNEQEALANLCETLMGKGILLKDAFAMLFDADILIKAAARNSLIALESFDDENLFMGNDYEALEINASSISPYNGKLDLIIDDIRKWKDQGYRISFAVPERSRVERLIEELRERDIFAVEAEKDARWPRTTYCGIYGHLQTGFVYKDEKLAVISESDIIGARSRKQRQCKGKKG